MRFGRAAGGVLVLALQTGCPPSLPAFNQCPDWGCGSNAASMGQNLSFHELDASTVNANSAGVRYLAFADATGKPLKLSVAGDTLIGTDAAGATVRGKALIGATLELERTGQHFEVRISDVGAVDYWVMPCETIPTYTFEYRPGHGEFAPMCTAHQLASEWGNVAPQLALVFAGDRYDAPTKTVTAVAPNTGEWFNIACAGTAVAKMHLLRHTAAGSNGAYQSSRDQRQAMLKMLTDDLCGTGRSFTVDGEEVYYTDQRDWYPLRGLPGHVEALWNAKGAVCLDEPRRFVEDPKVAADIAATCTLPPCAGMLKNWQLSAYGFSVNPLIPPQPVKPSTARCDFSGPPPFVPAP